MNDNPERDLAIFTEALRLPAAKRSEYLEQACAGDKEWRRRVEALLSAHERVGDFLEEPRLEVGPEAGTDAEDNIPRKRGTNGKDPAANE